MIGLGGRLFEQAVAQKGKGFVLQGDPIFAGRGSILAA